MAHLELSSFLTFLNNEQLSLEIRLADICVTLFETYYYYSHINSRELNVSIQSYLGELSSLADKVPSVFFAQHSIFDVFLTPKLRRTLAGRGMSMDVYCVIMFPLITLEIIQN